MSRNGSGTYVLPAGNPVVTGTVITSTWANTTLQDIATALTGSIASDGQTVVTGDIQMGNNRITGMADGIALTDAATLGQITNANITSGTINGAIIGNLNPQNGTFTNLVATVGTTTVNFSATGTATAPTVATTEDSTKIATTAYVKALIGTGENVVNSFNTRKGAVTLQSADVTGALGFTPPSVTGAGATGNWNINSVNVTGVVAEANGGTGLNDSGAAGNILTSTGTGWASLAPTGVPSGAILMWSGAIANIPAGWVLCDGNNNTPNLLDRFVIAAGSTYAVNATGGTANAIVVAHTHNVNASGTTSATDVNHVHGGTTDGMNANNPHAHGVSDPGHIHYGGSCAPNGGGGGIALKGDQQVANPTTGSGTGIGIGATDINHGHGFTTGGMNANVTHTHTFDASGATSSTGSDGTNANLPPYLALAYIMKT